MTREDGLIFSWLECVSDFPFCLGFIKYNWQMKTVCVHTVQCNALTVVYTGELLNEGNWCAYHLKYLYFVVRTFKICQTKILYPLTKSSIVRVFPLIPMHPQATIILLLAFTCEFNFKVVCKYLSTLSFVVINNLLAMLLFWWPVYSASWLWSWWLRVL